MIVVLIILHILPQNKNIPDAIRLEKSIAVLPFRNDSPDQDNEYFVNGTRESILELKKAQKLNPRAFSYQAWQPRAFLYARDYDRALKEHLALLKRYPEYDYAKRWCAVNYQLCGKMEEALSVCSEVAQQDWLVLLQVEVLYDNLRSEPRFQAILDKMNFPSNQQ